jgi:hypothetical protein
MDKKMELNPVQVSALDCGTPGGVYLCQVNDSISCAACCGLYNMANTEKAHLTALLTERSRSFSRTPRSIEAIDAFANQVLITESQERPFDDFHHCPFIGLIGGPDYRVGCLLHPMGAGNNGVDYRGMSYYGGMACRTYFCPTHYHLSPDYKKILRLVLPDWYLYGLIVTEKNLVQALFRRVENRFQCALIPDLFRNNPTASQKLVDLLAIKCDWPFRPTKANTICHYFFTDNPAPRPAVDYDGLGEAPSPWDDVFVELVSEFQSPAQLRRAEQLIEERVQAVVEALRGV